jgi:outer membrane receptor for ferric coprogen and ferric-rhodotorulic acid
MPFLMTLAANAAAMAAPLPSTVPVATDPQTARDDIVVTGQRTEGSDDYTISQTTRRASR